jgi:hypothetical protein
VPNPLKLGEWQRQLWWIVNSITLFGVYPDAFRFMRIAQIEERMTPLSRKNRENAVE